MPVEDMPVHEKVIEKEGARYGCFNRKPFADGYRAPNRYQTSDGYQAVFKIEAKFIPHVMSRECRYDMSLTDHKCHECIHRGSGEAYAARVRESASVK